MKDNTVYEIGMLINPNLSQQGAEKTVENIKDTLTKNSASVISEGEIVEIDLAYQVITKIASKNERFNEAFFAWVKFEVAPSKVQDIKAEVDKIKAEVFRYLIIKTVRDDEETDKFISEDSEEVEEETTNTETEDINSEEKASDSEEVVEDDLTKIEGIGPKTAEALSNASILTFADLADSKVGDLRTILEEHSLSRYDPKTWSKQARLARDGKWEELKELQDKLNGGEVLD